MSLLCLLYSIENISCQTTKNEYSESVMIQILDAALLDDLKSDLASLPNARYVEALTRDGLIHVLQLEARGAMELEEVLDEIRNLKVVRYIERYTPVLPRSIRPNDLEYFEQFQMINMEMEEVWCSGNRSTTVRGDTIVVAVIESDSNYLIQEDIMNNLWRNHAEIPYDGIDNDENGYIDDYYGIDAETEKGLDLDGGNSMHGLGVIGVLSAEGNNGNLLAGMAWHIKVLNVTKAMSNFDAIRAYDYVYEMRKQYNETNGAKGAYIVASNSSFGNDNFPENNPIWCSRYDLMSSVGILNVAAVRNNRVNIDEEGDVPGLCPSDGLITVTNLTAEDEQGRSGFSKTNVDLAAYGTAVPRLNDSDTIYFDSGTSFSAPLVTGLIGLFYGQACEGFIDLSKSDPEEAVSRMKTFVLGNALPIPSQIGRSVTEGKLDPRASQRALFDYCDFMSNDLEIDRIYYNTSGDLTLEYIVPNDGIGEINIHNVQGLKIYERVIESSGFGVLTVDLNSAPTGVYYLSLEHNGKMVSEPMVWLRK